MAAPFCSERCFANQPASKLSGEYGWRRFVGDFPKLLLLQFFLGLVPELILPTFGLSGLLPQLMGAGSYLIVCWVRHNGASIGKHGPSQPGRGLDRPRPRRVVPGRAYSSQPIINATTHLLGDVV